MMPACFSAKLVSVALILVLEFNITDSVHSVQTDSVLACRAKLTIDVIGEILAHFCLCAPQTFIGLSKDLSVLCHAFHAKTSYT